LINRPLAAGLVLAALLRCGGDDAPSKPAPQPPNPELLHIKGPDDTEDRNNLLNFAHGAVVVSRTGEFGLETSAQSAIDGDPVTQWVSPPGEPDQSLVFALPARTRLRAVGLVAGSEPASYPKTVTFDVSTDGKTFTSVSSFDLPPGGRNVVDITPVEASYIRYKTHGSGNFARTFSVIAHGELLAPVRPVSLDGCWSINGLDASFSQKGALVTGTVAGKTPITVDGGSDGRFYRLLWMRGPEYGVIGLGVTPDGQHLSAMFWHEEAYTPFIGFSWFGERHPCGTASRHSDVDMLATSMERYGRYAMYGLLFDDAGHLIEDASVPMLDRLVAYLKANRNLKIEAHELLQADTARNQAVSQAKVDSLRAALTRRGANLADVEFVAAGSDHPHRPASTDAARSMYGAVELLKR